MEVRYIDTRPRAPNAIFSVEVIGGETVRLTNVDTKHTTIVDGKIFCKHYEPIRW